MQVHRMLGVSYKSAWFMCHRIRESLRFNDEGPLGGEGMTVEADETFIGGKEKNRHRSKRKHLGTGGVNKESVFSLVERDGRARSFHMETVSADNLRPILVTQVKRSTALMTDNANVMTLAGSEFKSHQTVNHSIGEYVRGGVHTNTIEGYFSIMKRGITGVYHHVSAQHLKRYLAEFDYRYNEREALGVNDTERMAKSIKGIVGKRMTYRRIEERANKQA